MLASHPHAAIEYWYFKVNAGPLALLVDWIAPDVFPVRLLRMTDMALVNAPFAVFTGWVRHGAQRIELQRAPGMREF